MLYNWNFLGGSAVKESSCNTGDKGLIPGWERSPGEGNGNPLQYSCLGNPMGRGVWQATVQRVPQSQTWLKQLSTYARVCVCVCVCVCIYIVRHKDPGWYIYQWLSHSIYIRLLWKASSNTDCWVPLQESQIQCVKSGANSQVIKCGWSENHTLRTTIYFILSVTTTLQ